MNGEARHIITEFKKFVDTDPKCPKRLKLAYQRALKRSLDGSKFIDQTSAAGDYDRDMDEETEDFLNLTSLHHYDDMYGDGDKALKYDYGINYDWQKRRCDQVSSQI